MPEQVSKFESHRAQFVSGLATVAQSLRSCAQVADAFAEIVADTPYSPETAALLQGASESGKGKRKAATSPEEGEPKKRRRNIKPRDPNAPKRPASSYILFQNEVRKELKERHPGLSNAELMVVIADQWKTMSDEQKETYNQMMKTAKALYSVEKKAYDSRNQDAQTNVAKEEPQKEGAKSRATKPAPGTSVPKASPSTRSSEEEESDDEHPPVAIKSDASDEEEQSPPEPNNRRKGSVQSKAKKALK